MGIPAFTRTILTTWIFLLGAPANLGASEIHPLQTDWKFDFDSAQKKLSVDLLGSRYTLMTPDGVTKAGHDDDTLYLFKPGQKRISLVSKYELGSAAGSSLEIVPFGTISFAQELAATPILDFAVSQNGASAILFLTSAGAKPGYTKAHLYAFLKNRSIDEKSFFSEPNRPAGATSNARGKRIHTALVSFKGGAREVLGSGSITLVSDPEFGGTLLLSLDVRNRLIHEYGVSDPFEPIYLRSYPLPQSLLSELDQATLSLSDFKIDSTGSSPGEFFLDHPSFFPLRLSLIQMREEFILMRAAILRAWNNEVVGNVWTKQLLGWGALSTFIDSLDRSYSNPNVDIELLSQDPSIRAILDSTEREDLFRFARESGVFTADEIDQMRIEAELKHGRGRKHAITAALVVGLLGYVNVKDGDLIRSQASHLRSNVWAFCENALKRIGRSEAQIAAFRDWGGRMKLKFRSRLVKSAQLQRHPTHLIRTLEKKLQHARSALPAADRGRVAFKIDPSKAMDERTKTILKEWESLNAAQSATTQATAQALSQDITKLQTLERQIQLNDRLTRIKTKILLTQSEAIARAANARIPSVRELTTSEQNLSLIYATDSGYIRDQARQAIQALDKIEANLKGLAARTPANPQLANQARHFSEVLKPARKKDFTTELESLLSEAGAIDAQVASWTTRGKVHPFFDHWAKFSSLWARYFLPQTVRKGVGLESTWARRHLRQDFVSLADGTVEPLLIQGEHARLALGTGTFDVMGDLFTQWFARRNAADPNERIWGRGDHHIGMIPWNGHRYGPHFDLIATSMSNAWHWLTSMPVSYARMEMSFGSKSSIGILRRLWDEQAKALQNLPYSVANQYPFWFLNNQWIAWSYKNKHEASGDFDEVDFERFLSRIQTRTISAQSQLERIFFENFVGVPYINPQYYLQAEFNKASDLVFRSPWMRQLVSGMIMPLTTGYGYARWWGDYFGFNHPDTIEVMKELRIDGILGKIDAQGYTNLEKWTEHERAMFFFMVSLFEMERYGKENPLPENATAEQLAAWYKSVFKNLFGSENPDLSAANRSVTRLRVRMSKPTAISRDTESRYAAEAKILAAMFRNMKDGISKLPLVRGNSNNDTFALRVENTDAQESSAEQITSLGASLLRDATHINSAIADTLRIMKSNRGAFADLQGNRALLSLANALILGDQFFARGRALGLPTRLLSQWSATSQRILNRFATAGTIASLPLYLWLDDQAEAHLRNATANGEALRDLQSLLFSATELLIARTVAETSRAGARDWPSKLGELKSQLENNRRALEELLVSTQSDSQDLLHSGRYRWAKIYSEYSLFGLGMSSTWIISRYALFEASTGVILKMTDTFAPLLFKASALAWLYFGQERQAQMKQIALTTQDFFTVHQSYTTTLLTLELIRIAEQSAQSKIELPENLNALLESALQKSTIHQNMEKYRSTLLNLVNE